MSIGGTSQRDADIGRVRVIGQQSFRRLGGYLKHSAASSHKPSEILLYLPMGVPHATPPLTWSELAKPACGTHVVLLDIDPVKRKAVVDQLEAWGFRVSCVLDAHGLKTLVDEAVPRSFITLHVLEPLSSDTVADVKQTLDDTSSAAKSAKGIVWTVPDFIDVDSTGHPKGELEHTIRNVTNPADLLGIILEIMQPTAEQRALDPAAVLNASVQADLCLGHVLIVDDNPINLRVEKSMVEKRGYRVDVAYNGKEALEILATRPYDIVLMDCEMPIMDGFTATRHFRANERAWERTPIVAVSAHALEEDRKRCLDCGMDDFMSKPVSSVTLASVFARWSTPGQRIRHLSQLEDTDQMNMLHELAVLAEADRSCTSSSQFRELLTALQHAANLLGAQRMSTRCSWVLSSLATNDVDQQRHALADLDHEARALRILADD
jgi:CheY-like chemotaxis protein